MLTNNRCAASSKGLAFARTPRNLIGLVTARRSSLATQCTVIGAILCRDVAGGPRVWGPRRVLVGA